MSSSRTIEPSSSASTSLPEGELTGYYVRNSLLYRVSQGDREIVLDTPIPEAKPPIDSNIRDPDFREPRYISYQYPYLIFVPKYYAWRDPVFKVLDCSYSKIPIVGDRVGGFYLHPNVAEEMRDLENSLRGLGREILSLARNSIRKLGPELAAWFFPARFKFLQRFFTEKAARFAVWRSIQNFLPLLGYVSMALWCIDEEVKALAPGTAPDWRSVVIARTELKRTFLDAVEGSVAGNWDMPGLEGCFVSGLSRCSSSGARGYIGRRWLCWHRSRAMQSKSLYLSLGPLPTPKDMGRFRKFEKHLPTAGDKDLEKHPFMPDDMELKNLASPKGQFKFSRYTIGYDGALRRDPKQKKNESISSFFIRRKGENEAKMAKESPSDQQRRNSRQAHAATGAVPSKACVFFWEEEDGHYIRRPGGRGTYAQLWQEYPAPQRRFDPISNEWDLCELFENNDPCWGGAVTHHHQDDDEDETRTTTTPLAANEDMVSPLPHAGDGMKVAQSQHYHDLDMVVADDVAEEDLGPDFMEEDLPKFGHTPRTAAPEYESCADTLLGTLKQRFCFRLPPSPESFVPRELPPRSGDAVFANVVGIADVAPELHSRQGFEQILGIFFGQCLAARSWNGIDRNLLDLPEADAQPGFAYSRAYLSSMRNPAHRDYYYIVRKSGAGIGTEALLLRRATDLLEIMRQSWGSTIKDVVQHLVARGISFWLAYVSAEIMPACTPVSPWIRPKGFQADNISGLGFRPENYAFEEQDYNAYITRRDFQILHTPLRRGHRAYGKREVSDDAILSQSSDDVYDVGDCLWDGTSSYSYWYYPLSDNEIDLVCGVHHIGTGHMRNVGDRAHRPDVAEQEQTRTVSWWPKPGAWARGSLDGAWWTPQCEDFFQKRLNQFGKKSTFRKEVKNIWDGFEMVASSYLASLWPDEVTPVDVASSLAA
ncbi:hypothetical protein C8R43DRAFT_951557 [Mycena crocata]|nr:hypothetical protein C8R43DRAFT_951557 [Mycena crocata]